MGLIIIIITPSKHGTHLATAPPTTSLPPILFKTSTQRLLPPSSIFPSKNKSQPHKQTNAVTTTLQKSAQPTLNNRANLIREKIRKETCPIL